MAQHSIFIGYRRDDTADACSRIYERLEPIFGKDALFLDIDKIAYGDDFRARVKSIVPKCSVFLAVIGPRWIEAQDSYSGARRLDDPKDLVRVEIEIALATNGLQVIPVLINGASMPEAAHLPPSLQGLRELNAAKVRREDFNEDMRRLIKALQLRLGTGATVAVTDSDIPPANGNDDPWQVEWLRISESLDPRVYRTFLDECPQGRSERVQARHHLIDLEDWQQIDPDREEDIVAFIFSPGDRFPALFRHLNVLRKAARIKAEAKQRTLEQARAEQLVRNAAEAAAAAEAARKAQEERLAVKELREREKALERQREEAAAEAARKAEEERLAQPRHAAEAAKASQPVAERLFPIELPGVANWPTPQMIAIPPGQFTMGAPEGEESSGDAERPQHEVRINYAFALGQHTVTFADWDAALAAGAKLANPDDQGWGRGNRPVINVNWEDAQAFLSWLNESTGLSGRPDAYRLPSEAEWEYACRAGTMTPFSFGATISTAEANYEGNDTYGAGHKGTPLQKTTPVGSFPPNSFGLYDMHGNIWEWCQDCWNASYNAAPSDGSAWTTGDCSLRVRRGGSWVNGTFRLRSANRGRNTSTFRGNYGGFRLARAL